MSTRIYMTRVAATPTTPTFVPAIDPIWDRTAAFFTRWRSLPTRPDLSLNTFAQLFGATTTSETCFGQWITDPLATGLTIVGPFTAVIPTLETIATENAVLYVVLRIVTAAGAVRATLVSQNTATEFTLTLTTQVLTTAVTPAAAQAGDRLVLEVGARATTPTNTGFLGFQHGGATGIPDFPATPGLAGSQNGWWELADTLTFTTEPLPTFTRFYFPWQTPAPAGFAPAIATTWARTVGTFARYTATQRRTDTSPNPPPVWFNLFGSTATSRSAWGQWITDRLDRDQVIAGTVTLVMSGIENGATENAHLAFVLRVITPAGTFRGSLASVITSSTEFSVTPTFGSRVHLALPITQLSCLQGDRLVMEIGVHGVTPANTASIGLVYGAPGDPLGVRPDHVAVSGEPTASRVPWWELSQAVTFSTGTAPGGVALGLYDPLTGAEVRLNVTTFQQDPTAWRGQLRHSFNGTLLSSLRAPRRAWSATVEFGTEAEVDAFVRLIDAEPTGSADPTSFRGSKLLHLFSDPLGLLRSTAVIPVRVEVGARTPSEKVEDGILRNVWAVALTIRE